MNAVHAFLHFALAVLGTFALRAGTVPFYAHAIATLGLARGAWSAGGRWWSYLLALMLGPGVLAAMGWLSCVNQAAVNPPDPLPPDDEQPARAATIGVFDPVACQQRLAGGGIAPAHLDSEWSEEENLVRFYCSRDWDGNAMQKTFRKREEAAGRNYLEPFSENPEYPADLHLFQLLGRSVLEFESNALTDTASYVNPSLVQFTLQNREGSTRVFLKTNVHAFGPFHKALGERTLTQESLLLAIGKRVETGYVPMTASVAALVYEHVLRLLTRIESSQTVRLSAGPPEVVDVLLCHDSIAPDRYAPEACRETPEDASCSGKEHCAVRLLTACSSVRPDECDALLAGNVARLAHELYHCIHHCPSQTPPLLREGEATAFGEEYQARSIQAWEAGQALPSWETPTDELPHTPTEAKQLCTLSSLTGQNRGPERLDMKELVHRIATATTAQLGGDDELRRLTYAFGWALFSTRRDDHSKRRRMLADVAVKVMSGKSVAAEEKLLLRELQLAVNWADSSVRARGDVGACPID